MQTKLKSILGWLAMTILMTQMGCKKNLSSFYADPANTSLSIFSNRGYNIMSCYMNGQAWQTDNRTVGGFGSTHNEIYICKLVTNGLMDTLIISWSGHLKSVNFGSDNISLLMPVAKSFRRNDLISFEGKRIRIDSTNGFFAYTNGSYGYGSNAGMGTIYFEKAHIDSVSYNYFSGRFSGLFEAKIGQDIITNGRFDHDLWGDQVAPF
jgi:hypothetical protein